MILLKEDLSIVAELTARDYARWRQPCNVTASGDMSYRRKAQNPHASKSDP